MRKQTNFDPRIVVRGLCHEAFENIPKDASMLEILEAVCLWLKCKIIVIEGVFYFVPEGDAPSQEYLKVGLEQAKKTAGGV